MINSGSNKIDFYNSLNQTLKNNYQIESVSDINDTFINSILDIIIEIY